MGSRNILPLINRHGPVWPLRTFFVSACRGVSHSSCLLPKAEFNCPHKGSSFFRYFSQITSISELFAMWPSFMCGRRSQMKPRSRLTHISLWLIDPF